MSNEQKKQNSPEKRVAYREFGNADNSAAIERGVPDLPPQRQNLKIQASRKGRKGKTVTVISEFQTTEENLNQLLKQLKTQCGCGGTIKDNTIEIQGDHREKIMQLLLQSGYKAKISG